MKLYDKEDRQKIIDISQEWCERTRLELDYEDYVRVIQKDVNNYIIVDPKGNLVRKGAFTKELNNLDYDLPIVNEALVNYLAYNTPIEKTIMECNDYRKFQKIVKVSYLYDHAKHNGVELHEKVHRVFASRSINDGQILKCRWQQVKDGKELMKLRERGTHLVCDSKLEGEIRYKYLHESKIGNTPENCFIDNGHILDKEIPRKLDKNWYIELTKNRLELYLRGK